MSARNDITRALPSADDMERGLLSCMMQAPDWAIGKAQAIIKADAFHVPSHALIFRLLLEMQREGIPVDPVSVQQILMDRSLMDTVGGPATVAEIYTFAPTPANAAHYAAQIRDKATLRRLICASSATLEEAFTNPENPAEILTKAESRLLAIRDTETQGSRSRSGKEAMWATLDAIEQSMTTGIPMGIATGLRTLDEKIGGITQGLILIGGEPSGGKSVVAMLWTIALLRAGKRVLFYSIEMPTDACMRRMLAHLSGLPLMRLINPVPALTAHELTLLKRGTDEFAKFGHLLTINDDGGLTASDILSQARQEHTSAPLGAVVVDYVQRLTPEEPKATIEQQTSTSSRILKRLADLLGIPVISPVQLNEQNAVRGSRALGMDADVFVRIVHQRDKEGEPIAPDESGRRTCGLWVEKVRQGPRWFMIPCLLDGARMSFTETSH